MSIWNLIAGAGSAAGGYLMAEDMQALGEDAAAQMGQLGSQLQQDSAFTGYGVQTGLGNTTVGADGSTNLGVGQNADMAAAGASNYGSATGNYNNAANMAMQASGPNAWQQAGYGAAAGANNSLYGQAAGGLSAAQGMAMNNSFNPAYGMAMGAQGGAMQGLAGQQAGMLGASQQAMQNAMGDRAGREQAVYDRAMAMQQPGLDAARASQQAREFAQGRGGVRGSQFGGTAEDAATARAQAQAQNQASFQAMGQAESEMMNQANMANQFGQQGMAAAGMQSNIGNTMGALGAQQAQLGQGAAGLYGQMAGQMGQLGAQNYQNQLAQAAQMGQMGNQWAGQQQAGAGLMAQIAGGQAGLGGQLTDQSYLDMQHQLQAAQLGGQNADRAQTGQLTGAGYASQLGLGGIQSQINANVAAGNLYGDMFGAGMNAIGNIDPEQSLWNLLGL